MCRTGSVRKVPQQVSDVVEAAGFDTGLLVGGSLLVVLCALALVRRRASPSSRWRRAPGVAAEALCVGCLLAMDLADLPVPRALLLGSGLIALAAGGWIAARVGLAWRIALVAPGAALVGATLPSGIPRFVGVTTILVGGAAIAEFGRWAEVRPAGPAMLTITVVGVYLSTPDTEHAVVALGVALAIGCAGWPLRVAAVSGGGGAAFVGLVAWLACTDGLARPGSIVGACACVGAFALAPIAGRRWPRSSVQPKVLAGLPIALTVALGHGLVVLLCSRVAAPSGPAVAAVVVALVFTVSAWALWSAPEKAAL